MEATHARLRSLISNATEELRKEGGAYGSLLVQLEVLQRSFDATEPSVELLSSTLRAFPAEGAFPAKEMRTRGGAPAGMGLRETRRLWEELNRIVEARQEPKAKKISTRASTQR
jgi:hypothetical protein